MIHRERDTRQRRRIPKTFCAELGKEVIYEVVLGNVLQLLRDFTKRQFWHCSLLVGAPREFSFADIFDVRVQMLHPLLQARARHPRNAHGVGRQVRGGGRQRRRQGRGPRQTRRRDVPHHSAQGDLDLIYSLVIS